MKSQQLIIFGVTLSLFLTACLPSPPTEEAKSISENIPLDVTWKAEGPGAIGVEYKDGKLELKGNLQGGDAYAELFLDLRNVSLPEIEQNSDGTYNLAGTELVAMVRSDQDFKGDPEHPNGVQFLLKNEQFKSSESRWLDVSGAMASSGMEVFFKVPNDNDIARETAGISLKFTIGSNSTESYEGSFFIDSVTIEKK